jgi:cyanobactin maturation PatA/PatG family protease
MLTGDGTRALRRWDWVVDIRSALTGLRQLQTHTLGDSQVCIAVLDGPVDLTHPCFVGANLDKLDTLVQEKPGQGRMSLHGTHVASLLFGQPGSPVVGLAPKCRGLIVPIFHDDQPGPVSQLDLARAIEQAVQAGAHIISVSGGERSPTAHADSMLDRVLRTCKDNDVLVVAAVGNDGCACLQVPAAVPSVLAVGAIGTDGQPLKSSNWGETYLSNGVLAPGQDIDGAAPGGGIAALTGTSFATPIVAGVAALLLSIQRQTGRADGAPEIRNAILETASPCHPLGTTRCRPYLVGTLNVPAAYEFIRMGGTKAVTNSDVLAVPSPPALSQAVQSEPRPVEPSAGVSAAGIEHSASAEARNSADEISEPHLPVIGAADNIGPPPGVAVGQVPYRAQHFSNTPQDRQPGNGVVAASECGCDSAPGSQRSLIYAIGKIAIDFGTEANRDGFRQQMPRVDTQVIDVEQSPARPVFGSSPPNPYDPYQLSDYLRRNPWASNKLIWTLNLERTPIYALEAETPYGMDWGQTFIDAEGKTVGADLQFPPVSPVYRTFRDALVGHALDPDKDPDYISMVSIPGVLTNRTVRLFTGQIVPVVVVSPRGMYSWNEPKLVEAASRAVQEDAERQRSAGRAAANVDDLTVRQNIRAFLDKVYFQFRNLGQSPADRALNYAATNAFMVADTLREGFTSGTYVPGQNVGLYSLDTITVSKSPYCRQGSDCWDVELTFFDPENERRARVSYLFTMDVSEVLPVSLAPSHRFLVGTPQLEGRYR